MRTIQNWRKKGLVDSRKGAPKGVGNKLSTKERQQVIDTACSKEFQDYPPCAIVPRLADKGIYLASESSFYRILRSENLTVRKEKRPSKSTPVELKADIPNSLWSWDITYLKTSVKGRYYYLYLFMDVYSRFITGSEVHEQEDKNLSSAMMARICKEQSIQSDQLILHADNGGPMKNATMFAVLQKLGVTESFSRPGVSNDNAFSESLFSTLKSRAGYPASFESLDQAREWVARFVRWYNYEHRHSGIGYVTPMERHTGKDIEILEKRKEVFETARQNHPKRWSRHCRKWNRTETVYLKRAHQKKLIA